MPQTLMSHTRIRCSVVRDHSARELLCSMWLEVGIVLLLSVILSAVILSVRRVRDGIISSKAYKKGFALHMNIFSRLHNKAVEKHKKELFATLPFTFNNVEGDILEIGSGTGANFQFFPKGSSVIALDPNPHMESYLKSNCSKFPHIHLKRCVTGFAEEIKEVQDNSVAAVVCTLTLCSVEDVTRVLQEVKRVLKPGGHFYFLEHVAAERGTVRHKLQQKLDNFWKYLSDGCTCARDAASYIEDAGFSKVCCERFVATDLTNVCFLMKPHVMGFAVK